MERQIRYVKSADGTRIAVSALGQGRPLVIVPTGWLTTIDVFWQVPQVRANLEALAGRRMVVQYDMRGIGLSERAVDDFSLEARLNDLAAVVESLGSPVIDLFGQVQAAPTAISHAVQNRDSVGALVLVAPLARARDMVRDSRQRALRYMLDVDWQLYVKTWSLLLFDWTELGQRVAQEAAKSITSEGFLRAARAVREDDVTDLLAAVRCPTLVMHQQGGDQWVPSDSSQMIAATIPKARFVPFEQQNVLTLADESATRIIEAFLDECTGSSRASELPSGTAIILFADIADSTPLTEKMGDGAFRAKARELDGALRAAITASGGTCIDAKTLGDGVLATFTSAREAIEAGVACAGAGASAGMPLHVGIHAGDVIREDNNVYGGAVNVASRVAGLSAAGEVLVSETVRSLARTSAGVRFEDRGEQALKGVGEAVRVWAVTPDGGQAF